MNNCKHTELVYEDTVQCTFYLCNTTEVDICWEQRAQDINQLIKKLSHGYIWHRDEFDVCLPMTMDKETTKRLIGTTCFGDNIDDEWFIVYLILKITETFQDMIVHVSDSDGDFLLIEAADFLPQWANPNSTDKRVFIHNGSIHIIPPSLKDDSDLDIEEAISLISLNPKITIASPEVQKAITERIGNYPEKISHNLHTAIVNLPSEIASLLKMNPALIAQLVTTYCNMDSIDDKLCKDLNFEEVYPVEVKFTKCLYAMLMHSKLLNFRKKIFQKNLDKRHEIGVKLTCGYNILMHNSDDIYSTKQFMAFKDSLTKNGYFNNNIEGSKDYNTLLNNAKNYFMSIECPNSSKFFNTVNKLKQSNDYNKFKDSLQSNPIEELKEDSDAWLSIDPEELNIILNKRYGQKIDKIQPETMSSQLTEFLQQTSNFEGIELNEFDSTLMNDDLIEFDTDEFMSSLQKMLKIVSDEKHVDLDSDEYTNSDNDEVNIDIDQEVKDKLYDKEDLTSNKSILNNIVQSLKEEKGFSGPSSNILRSIGINKEDLLDSDDDE